MTYPRLPRNRELRRGQFSLRALIAMWLVAGAGIAGLAVGGFPRFVVGMTGSLAVFGIAAWLVAQLRPLTASFTTAYTCFGVLILSVSKLGGLPVLRNAFFGGFRGSASVTGTTSLVIGWYLLLLLLGMAVGTVLASVRARDSR